MRSEQRDISVADGCGTNGFMKSERVAPLILLILDLENMEPGHWEMFFPSEKDWRLSAPPWAIERRSEIARRVAEGWRPKDFHLPPDLDDT